jgi:hypothetical protein
MLVEAICTQLLVDSLLKLRTFFHFDLTLEDVVFKESVLHPTIWKGHHTLAVLDTHFPFSFVDRGVNPVHLTVTLSIVVDVVSVVDVSALPGKVSDAILFIELVVAFKLVALDYVFSLAPLPVAVLHALLELARIDASILPLVDSLPLWFSKGIVSLVYVSIGKAISSLPMLEAVDPASFELVSVLPLMHAIAISLAVLPLT